MQTTLDTDCNNNNPWDVAAQLTSLAGEIDKYIQRATRNSQALQRTSEELADIVIFMEDLAAALRLACAVQMDQNMARTGARK